MSSRVHILSIDEEHTTARYFHLAATACGREVIYCSSLRNGPKIGSDDLLVFIDPTIDWPLGLESVQCKRIAYLIDVHQGLSSRLTIARFFDVVFVAQKDYVQHFAQIGVVNAHWLPLGCDPDVHCVPSRDRPLEVGFVGKLGSKGGRRNRSLRAVLPRYLTNDYMAYCSPREMARVYARSKIVFNASINGDVNMRLFEGMAAGALVVTDRIENGLSDLFREGEHYVGYSTEAEAIEKIDYFLSHPEERERIAASGQKAALSAHTYRHRWQEVERISAVSKRCALVDSYDRRQLGEVYAEIFVALRRPSRIISVLIRYGPSAKVCASLLRAWARWINARLPLTPNAIRARLNRG